MPFLLNDIQKEPEIVTLEEPICFVGISKNTNTRGIYKDSVALADQYQKHKAAHPIPNLKEPWAFVAYSKDFDEKTKSWDYILGDVVQDLGSIPEGMEGFKVPPGTYAVIPVRAKFRFLWGLEIARTKKHLIQEWLPGSEFTAAGDDFEYHDHRSMGKNARIDYYLAVEEKDPE